MLIVQRFPHTNVKYHERLWKGTTIQQLVWEDQSTKILGLIARVSAQAVSELIQRLPKWDWRTWAAFLGDYGTGHSTESHVRSEDVFCTGWARENLERARKEHGFSSLPGRQ